MSLSGNACPTQIARQIWDPWYRFVIVPCETEIAMLVGYARTSSLAQVAGLEAQERELRAAGCDKIFAEQVSSVAEREQLEAALDYVREGDTFTVTKLDRLARSVGDLLEIVARLEAKKVSLRVLAMSGARAARHRHGDRQADVGGHRCRWTGRAGGHARTAEGGHRQSEGVRAAIRAVCRPPGARLTRSSGSRRKASGPLKSPAGWGLDEPACIGCWASGRRWRRDRSAAIRSRPGLTLPTCLPQTVKEVFVIFFAHVRRPVARLVLQYPGATDIALSSAARASHWPS